MGRRIPLVCPDLRSFGAGFQPVSDERGKPNPIALAMEWVAKITTVGLEMALPAIGGGYLDQWLGTTYWALVGVVLGVIVGMWHLLQMTRPKTGPRHKSDRERTNGGSAGK
jgi:F0F1-type ATP synthase assembly protein I